MHLIMAGFKVKVRGKFVTYFQWQARKRAQIMYGNRVIKSQRMPALRTAPTSSTLQLHFEYLSLGLRSFEIMQIIIITYVIEGVFQYGRLYRHTNIRLTVKCQVTYQLVPLDHKEHTF